MQEVTCKVCRYDLETSSKVSAHDKVSVNSSNLMFPSETLISNLMILLRGIDNLLPDICTKAQLKKDLLLMSAIYILIKWVVKDTINQLKLSL